MRTYEDAKAEYLSLLDKHVSPEFQAETKYYYYYYYYYYYRDEDSGVAQVR
jgi:hypothetical protein